MRDVFKQIFSKSVRSVYVFVFWICNRGSQESRTCLDKVRALVIEIEIWIWQRRLVMSCTEGAEIYSMFILTVGNVRITVLRWETLVCPSCHVLTVWQLVMTCHDRMSRCHFKPRKRRWAPRMRRPRKCRLNFECQKLTGGRFDVIWLTMKSIIHVFTCDRSGQSVMCCGSSTHLTVVYH